MGAVGCSPRSPRREGADAAQGGPPLSALVSDLPEARLSTVTPVANVSFYPPGAGRLRLGYRLLVDILGGGYLKK